MFCVFSVIFVSCVLLIVPLSLGGVRRSPETTWAIFAIAVLVVLVWASLVYAIYYGGAGLAVGAAFIAGYLTRGVIYLWRG